MVFDIGSAVVEKQSPSIMIKEEWLTVLMLQFRRVKNRRADEKDKNEKEKKNSDVQDLIPKPLQQ